MLSPVTRMLLECMKAGIIPDGGMNLSGQARQLIRKNILLFALTSWVDVKKKAICLVHAGWKGLHKKIITQAIQRMKTSFKTDVSDLTVALGPSLRSCCYEVGKEFIDFFPGATSFRGGKLYLDMARAAVDQLLKSGVESGQIYDTHLCTSCLNQEFFSYRREGEHAGRSMSILKIA